MSLHSFSLISMGPEGVGWGEDFLVTHKGLVGNNFLPDDGGNTTKRKMNGRI